MEYHSLGLGIGEKSLGPVFCDPGAGARRPFTKPGALRLFNESRVVRQFTLAGAGLPFTGARGRDYLEGLGEGQETIPQGLGIALKDPMSSVLLC